MPTRSYMHIFNAQAIYYTQDNIFDICNAYRNPFPWRWLLQTWLRCIVVDRLFIPLGFSHAVTYMQGFGCDGHDSCKLVLFSSGPENLHAVGPVSPTHRDGTPAASRYTLNLWLSPEENAVLSNFPEVEKLLGETAA